MDLNKASEFMATHARMLDRRRFESLTGTGDRDALLAAVNSYRNPDGGYGHGLEPDLRSRTSQPGAALHAFEVFAELAPVTVPEAVALCDWLESVTLPDGGLPFALPVPDPTGCAPFWTGADPEASSLQITAVVAAMAQRVADHHEAVAAHPWLRRATRFCLDTARTKGDLHALELVFTLWLADAVHDVEVIELLGRQVPKDGLVHVQGGLPDEMMRPLDFAPYPDRPVRALFDPDVVDAELRRLDDQQQEDGGWRVDFASYSPAAELEWRGYTTVRAVSILSGIGYS
ncbi:hypothetical protein BZB76_6717 [Actinomadura pelletieri DSM 43383]|uniref:Prenyltransferase/squalene oxidase-like repeat protein n=1 Tax=Actinomadura pelletieri DSM 43383 TaxID=1120940 RepID=A0A495Q8X9_9ACTN|nr:hypothetical protein [Actinomadura pelletieri]RKS67765.1 hypothetical protein BZB76_6717 [Actinomadura pelletieri DSM 43383]